MANITKYCTLYNSTAIGFSITLVFAYMITIVDIYFSKKTTRNKFTLVPLYIAMSCVVCYLFEFMIISYLEVGN